MFYRIKYLLITTILLYATLPIKVAFPQSGVTDIEKKDVSQQDLSIETGQLRKEQLSKKALQLYNLGIKKYNQYKYREALENFQQAVPILEQINDKTGKAATFNYIGQIYINLKQYSKALEFLNLALNDKLPANATAPISNNNPPSESQPPPLSQNPAGMGNNPPSESEKQSCITCTSMLIGETTSIINKTEEKELNGAIKNNLGLAYLYQGEYDKAEESINQALDFFRKIDDKTEQGNTLNNLGELYRHRSQYPKAFKYLNQAKEIFQENKNQPGIGTTFNNIGLVHDELGQHSQALKHYQNSLKIRKQIRDEHGIGTTFHNIGFVYDQLEEYNKALNFYQQALKIYHKVNNRGAKGTTLNNMGLIHNKLGQNTLALQYLKQSLFIFQKLNYPLNEANTLDSLGTVYKSQGKYKLAYEAYQKALNISRRIQNRALERIILSNTGDLLVEQKQPQLAIIFYKQSIKITEEIRKDLQTLPLEQQKSYTKTVADTYRRLADLLLKQNGVQEAQQVLDLLKVQEVEDYLHSTQRTKAQRLDDYLRNRQTTKTDVTILPPEQEILKKYNQQSKTAIELGQELTQLQNIPDNKRTPAQQKRIYELVLLQQDLNKQFNQFAQREDIVQLLQELNPEARSQILDIKSLDALRDDLRRLNAVIVYPLILDDRLELVITTPDSPPLHRTVNIKSSELNQEIVKFRKALQNPNSDVKSSARQLYNLLIKPLEKDLNQANPKTIIYAPDGKLRYIPLAALHDGNQWLIERYQVNNITAKSLTDFTAKPKSSERLLAGAFVQGKHNVKVGERYETFSGLPFTLPEVENLADIIPQTKKLINDKFSKNAIISSINEYNIIHFATHAAFVPEDATQSFILFGNGDKVTLEEIGNWTLNNVEMVVLSACETGLGGNFGNGEEILGLGYQFQNRGVRTTIASLWKISDGGTQVLMNAFYSALKDNVTKAEALQQAQIALIKNDDSAVGGKQRGLFEIVFKEKQTQANKIAKKFEHPYYWASFILIGNGL
ncbi:MAG: CHAT domain-containing protein [Cyanobacteria bacterium P01_A01_bin.84]